MAHPYHTGVPGQQGGSRPAVANNHMKACADILPAQQKRVGAKMKELKNPAGRLPK